MKLEKYILSKHLPVAEKVDMKYLKQMKAELAPEEFDKRFYAVGDTAYEIFVDDDTDVDIYALLLLRIYESSDAAARRLAILLGITIATIAFGVVGALIYLL